MKRQKSCAPRWGKLVCQLPKSVIFSYDLHLGCMIASFKDLSEDYTFSRQTLAKANSVNVVGLENVV
jgi:hypothetical protein